MLIEQLKPWLFRIIRGGSWPNAMPNEHVGHEREYQAIKSPISQIGFRVARTIKNVD